MRVQAFSATSGALSLSRIRLTHYVSRITYHVSRFTFHLPHSIRPCSIQINQYISRLGALTGADDAAVFQFVHDAGGAAIAEAQTPLQERDAGFLFAPNHFDALLDDLLVLVN